MSHSIVWQSTFNIGIKVVDEQHQHLVEMINEMEERLDSTMGQIDLDDFFQEFVNYGEYHFQTEETLFNRSEYPEREAHLAAHIQYRKTLQDFLIREGDRRAIAGELLDFLHEWWVSHITGMDQTLREFVA